MRAIIYKRGGYDLGVIGETGGEASGEVFLFRDPVEWREASTKNYTDNKLASLVTSSFTQGTIDPLYLPAFSGAIVKGAGSSVLTAPDSGVTVGTYTKVLVNNKGIVYNSSALAESDVPELNWSKITSGKPTTLVDYGITNGLALTGGTMTGTLQIDTVIPDPQALANKDFVDGQGSSGLAITTGGIVYRTSATTPTGYLRCNGGIIDINIYSALYSVIGETFTDRTTPGSGQPWSQQYRINFTQNGNISDWVINKTLPAVLYGHACVVTNNRVYVIGGYNSSNNEVTTVRYCPLNADGTLGTWVTGTALPKAMAGARCIVAKNMLYVIGGQNGTNSVSGIFYTTINTDGSLGAWTETSFSFVHLPRHDNLVLIKNKIYCLGYSPGSKTVVKINLNTSGIPTGYTYDLTLPETIVNASSVFVIKDKVYLTFYNRLYSATINTDDTLGVWVRLSDLPFTVSNKMEVVTTNYYIYMAVSNNVYYAPINPDGTIGTWVTGTALPNSFFSTKLAIVKNKIYILGGTNGSIGINSICTGTLLGGLNDYSPYYGDFFEFMPSDQFKLPDTTSKLPGTYAYIKY